MLGHLQLTRGDRPMSRLSRFLYVIACFALALFAPGQAAPEALPPGALAQIGTPWFRYGNTCHVVAFTPDSKVLASSHGDRIIRLWDAATGKEIRRLTGHITDVRALAISP